MTIPPISTMSTMNASARLHTAPSNGCEGTSTMWSSDDYPNRVATANNSVVPFDSGRRTSLKSKLLNLGANKRDPSSISDSSSITTSSTLDDTSMMSGYYTDGSGIIVRHLPNDRQPLLPPRSPQQQKKMVQTLHEQYSPRQPQSLQHPRSPSQRVCIDSERYIGPIDVDSLCDDIEVVMKPMHESTSDTDHVGPVSITGSTSSGTAFALPYVPSTQGEIDKFLRLLQSSGNFSPAAASSTMPGPIDVDDFYADLCSPSSDLEEYIILDEVELCRELTGYHEGCEPELITDCSLMTWDEEDEEQGDDDDVPRNTNSRHNTSATTANSRSTPQTQNRLVVPLTSQSVPPKGHRRHPSTTSLARSVHARTVVHHRLPHKMNYSSVKLPKSAAEV